MKRIAGVILLLLTQTIAGAGQQPSDASGIEGVVTRRSSGEPIPGVRVTLNGTPQSIDVFTDNQGRFAFTSLRPGSYRLFFSRNGYVRQELGRSLFAGQGVTLALAAGQTVRGIVMQLTPTAVVSGRVHELGGGPLAGVQVDLLRQTYDATGSKKIQRVGSTLTNDRGEYRLFYITPGRYILSASVGPAVLANQVSPGVSPNAFALSFGATYHPSGTDPTQAVVLELGPGTELDGIDVSVRPHTFNIRGQIVGGPAVQGLMFSLLRMTPTGELAIANDGPALARAYSPATGVFELRNLRPGSYVVAAAAQDAAALVPVSLESADINGLNISLSPRISIRGSFKGDQPEVSKVAGYGRIRVILRPAADVAAPLRVSGEATFSTDNDFTIDGLLSLEYRLSVTALPPGLYVKEARLNNTDALAQPLRNLHSGDKLDIVIGAGAGLVEGVVTDDNGRPAPGFPVAVIPALQAHVDQYKDAVTDVNGRFRIPNVPPGDYMLFAFEEIEPYVWFDSDFLDRFKVQGRAVRVEGSSQNAVELKLIPNVSFR